MINLEEGPPLGSRSIQKLQVQCTKASAAKRSEPLKSCIYIYIYVFNNLEEGPPLGSRSIQKLEVLKCVRWFCHKKKRYFISATPCTLPKKHPKTTTQYSLWIGGNARDFFLDYFSTLPRPHYQCKTPSVCNPFASILVASGPILEA